MDAAYVSRCVQKAASLRKHDAKLWFGYSQRLLELQQDLSTDELGYVLWGYGKSSFVDQNFYEEILKLVKERLPDFRSHGLMSLMRLGGTPVPM